MKKIALARLGRSATQVPKKKTPSEEGPNVKKLCAGLDEFMDPATRPFTTLPVFPVPETPDRE